MSRQRGFTLIELMIVISIIVTISAIALPNLIASRISANESAAIATLKQIVSSQAIFQNGGSIDQDADGAGEFGWLAEMTGTVQMRDAVGPHHGPFLSPPTIAHSLGHIDANGVVNKSGYVYRLSLPGAGGVGLNEAPNGGSPTGEDPDACEKYWIGYAWPSGFSTSGRRAFCVNQKGDIIQTNNAGFGAITSYTSAASVPTSDAAMENGASGTITGAFSISALPAPATDGNLWTIVN